MREAGVGAFAYLGFGAFMVASCLVGARLLRLGARTRELPELSIGLALSLAALSYALNVAAPILRGTAPVPAHALLVCGVVAGNVGTGALFFGVWRIFRPADGWAGGVFGAAACALCLTTAAMLVTPVAPPHAARALSVPLFTGYVGTSLLGFGWSAFESFRYHALLRRRDRVGLGEPAVAHRFLLWGCAATAAMLCCAVAVLNRALVVTGMHPVALAATSVLGLVAAIAIWLAFFPPAFYRRSLSAAR